MNIAKTKLKTGLDNMDERIQKIEERNKRVELDKAWETCWTRKICIMILTYIIVIIYSTISFSKKSKVNIDEIYIENNLVFDIN